MAHMMDGAPIIVGDSVHDILHGPGTVVELKANDRVRVRFGQKYFVYDANGVIVDSGYRRTLYWRDPVLFPPQKDDVNFHLTRKLVQDIYNRIKTELG